MDDLTFSGLTHTQVVIVEMLVCSTKPSLILFGFYDLCQFLRMFANLSHVQSNKLNPKLTRNKKNYFCQVIKIRSLGRNVKFQSSAHCDSVGRLERRLI